MTLAKEGENNIVLFNIGGSNESQEIHHSTNMSKLSSAIPTIELKPHIRDGKLDKNLIVSEILDQTEHLRKTPILNIQFNSNMEKPLFDENDLAELKEMGINVCLTFSNYNAQNQDVQTNWKPLLSNVNHVFFANANDQVSAVDKNHVLKAKTSYIQSMQVSNLIESEILKRPPNILLSGKLPNKEKLNEVVDAAKELGNTRVIIASNPASIDDVTNIIASKFGISNEDQQSGIRLEVEEILQDKVGGAKKLENYISQLSQQFQKDIGKIEINPVDIYFDLSNPQKLQNITKQAKYTVQQGYAIESLTNGCIPLGQGQGKSYDIAAEVKQREAVRGINSVTVQDMQESLNEYKPENVIKRVINTFKQMTSKGSNTISTKQDRTVHATPKGSDLTRSDYLYNEDDIGNLLKASVDQTKVSVITHASLQEKELLKNTLKYAVYSDLIADGKETVIIPLNTGHEHWVSLAITKDQDNKIVFTYNDPVGTEIDNRPELLAMIKEVCPNNAKIVDLKIEQQKNDKDCGPFIVDNLTKMAKGERIFPTDSSNDMGAKLRAEHAKTMNIVEQIKEKTNGLRKAIASTSTVLPATSCRPSISPVFKNNTRPMGKGI